MSVDIRLLRSGKVRDIYNYDENHYLFHTTDRVSAFDVILNEKIPGKGKVLNDLTAFWKKQIEQMPAMIRVKHDLVDEQPMIEFDDGDAILVKKLKPLPVEAIVRGFIIGSGWKDYQRTGGICGISLPEGLKQAQPLPEPLYTPSTKADIGDHDENISYEETVNIIGAERAELLRDVSVELYKYATYVTGPVGIIIADTKFEFGEDENGDIYIIDEVLTPDSSRFWDIDEYEVGTSPPSFDKQIIRDYLETLDWDKTPPPPPLPEDIIQRTADRYTEVAKRIMGSGNG